jgi:hypothetical protein
MPRFALIVLAPALVFFVFAGSRPKDRSFAQALENTCGGKGGTTFNDENGTQEGFRRVVEVQIRAGSLVDAIRVVHEDRNGQRYALPAHGGAGGRLYRFELDHQGSTPEFIKKVNVRCGQFVDSIRIETNLRTSPHYGGRGGSTEEIYEAYPGQQIVGFQGRAGSLLDAITGTVRRNAPP